MFVDHLTDAITEQHDELVERIDLALQFDAVHEVDRNRHALFAQGVEEGILQRLATGHGCNSLLLVSLIHSRRYATARGLHGNASTAYRLALARIGGKDAFGKGLLHAMRA